MMRRSMSLMSCLLAVAALTGCAAKEAKWTAEAAQYAVYATQIPLYPGAKCEDVMGSDSYGDEPESHTEGMAWWYNVSAPKDKVVAWYEARLPKAVKTDGDDGSVVFTVEPEGGEAGEDMGVIIEEGKLRVFEHSRAGKHKA
jgi:hypothetical protein